MEYGGREGPRSRRRDPPAFWRHRPADARLLSGDEVSVDQSALTGKSLPATRDSGDAIFSGSIIRRGEIDALVYSTGGQTDFGKTAKLVETAITISHFQKAVLNMVTISSFSRWFWWR